MHVVYAIWFPTADDRSVYVGITKEPRFKKRTYEHKNLSKTGHTIVYKWMRRRIADGHAPHFVILETCPTEEAGDKEIEWQLWFSMCGWKGKHQKGGLEQFGYVFTEEHKRNISKSKLGKKTGPHSEATKKKLSKAWTPERLAKHKIYMQDPIRRANLSASMKLAIKEGRKKPSTGPNNVRQWTCACGKTMKATAKGMHLTACVEDGIVKPKPICPVCEVNTMGPRQKTCTSCYDNSTKVLCEICKVNMKSKTASKCMSCYNDQRRKQ